MNHTVVCCFFFSVCVVCKVKTTAMIMLKMLGATVQNFINRVRGGFCTLAAVHNILVYMQNITTYCWEVQLWAVSLAFDQLHLITCIFDV